MDTTKLEKIAMTENLLANYKEIEKELGCEIKSTITYKPSIGADGESYFGPKFLPCTKYLEAWVYDIRPFRKHEFASFDHETGELFFFGRNKCKMLRKVFQLEKIGYQLMNKYNHTEGWIWGGEPKEITEEYDKKHGKFKM